MWGNRQAGHSLIEVIVSLAILGIVTSFVVGMCTRQQKSSAKSFARSSMQKDVDQIVAFVKRDMKVQVPGGLGMTAGGTGLVIQRISPNQNNPAVSYRVQFQSVCAPFAAGQADHNAVYDASFRSALASGSSCIAKLNCGPGTYPAIEITTAGTQPLSYEPHRLPTLGKSLIRGPAGLALCVQAAADQITLRTESVLVDGSPGAWQPQVLSKVFSFPLPTSGDLTLIPN